MPWSCLVLCEWLCLIGLQLLENHPASAAQYSPISRTQNVLQKDFPSNTVFLWFFLLSFICDLVLWLWILQMQRWSLFTIFNFHRLTDVCNVNAENYVYLCVVFVLMNNMNILISGFKIRDLFFALIIIMLSDLMLQCAIYSLYIEIHFYISIYVNEFINCDVCLYQIDHLHN